MTPVKPKVGDVVVHKYGPGARALACGSGVYSGAVVACEVPFILVSAGGDMLWTCEHPSDYEPICQAHIDVQQIVYERWLRVQESHQFLIAAGVPSADVQEQLRIK